MRMLIKVSHPLDWVYVTGENNDSDAQEEYSSAVGDSGDNDVRKDSGWGIGW